MVFKLINISNTFSLLKVKIHEPERSEGGQTNRFTLNLMLSSPLNTFTRTYSSKTRIYGKDA